MAKPSLTGGSSKSGQILANGRIIEIELAEITDQSCTKGENANLDWLDKES